MDIKKKLIIMGVCIVIVIAVLAANVIRRLNYKEEDSIDKEEVVKEDIMTIAEAYRLLSYLEYDKKGREALKTDINYADEDMSGWYDSYVNAVWKMGLIGDYYGFSK